MELSPPAVPAQGQAFAAPEIIHLAHKGQGLLYHRPALRRKILRQSPQQIQCVWVADSCVFEKAGQCRPLRKQIIQGLLLEVRKAVDRLHLGGVFSGDGNGQCGLGSAVINFIIGVGVQDLDRLFGACEIAHLPENGLQFGNMYIRKLCHIRPLFCPCGICGKYSNDIFPIGRCTVQDDICEVAGLQRSKPGVQLHIDLRHCAA